MQGCFEFVVLSYNAPIPGQEGYDEKKDHLKSGFQFGGSVVPGWMPSSVKSVKEITAYDFLTNPKTGLRQGMKDLPDGTMVTSLDHGISGWHDIPPLWIWNKGQWLTDLLEDEAAFDMNELPTYFQTKVKDALKKASPSLMPAELFPFWVTSGEGTTGNYIYKIFKLPDEIASTTYPKHPVLWRKELKKTFYSGSGSGYSDFGVGGKSSGSTYSGGGSSSSAASLPFGVRIRCSGCGHWFKENDLPGHARVCDPTGDADWAMMCCDECGCRNLDEATKPKPGFPRPKKVEPEKAETKDPESTKAVADKKEEEATETK